MSKEPSTAIENLILFSLVVLFAGAVILALQPEQERTFSGAQVSANIKDCYAAINQFPVIVRNEKGEVTDMFCTEERKYEPVQP